MTFQSLVVPPATIGRINRAGIYCVTADPINDLAIEVDDGDWIQIPAGQSQTVIVRKSLSYDNDAASYGRISSIGVPRRGISGRSVADPAAGADPAATTLVHTSEIIGFSAQYVASAVVASRDLILVVSLSTVIVSRVTIYSATASQTVYCGFGSFVVGGTMTDRPFMPIIVPAGYNYGLRSVGISAADQWSDVEFLERELRNL